MKSRGALCSFRGALKTMEVTGAMFEDMIPRMEEAVQNSRKWAENGWQMGFGPKSAPVNNLKEAEALPRSFIYREESVNYWRQIRLMGNDAADAGASAIEALKNGDIDAAEKALYLASYIERPYESYTCEWKTLHDTVKERMAECV